MSKFVVAYRTGHCEAIQVDYYGPDKKPPLVVEYEDGVTRYPDLHRKMGDVFAFNNRIWGEVEADSAMEAIMKVLRANNKQRNRMRNARINGQNDLEDEDDDPSWVEDPETGEFRCSECGYPAPKDANLVKG